MGLKLGDFSPLAAAVTGEGFASNFGVLPAMHARQVEKAKARDAANAANAMAEQEAKAQRMQELAAYREQNGLKKGGKVRSASQRADGCAIRGKTRA
jgi:hypothetical protein